MHKFVNGKNLDASHHHAGPYKITPKMRIQASITLTSPPESNKSEALQFQVELPCIHYNVAGVVILSQVCAQILLKHSSIHLYVLLRKKFQLQCMQINA